jgi:hypothetical protein
MEAGPAAGGGPLHEACWSAQQSDRPSFSTIVRLLSSSTTEIDWLEPAADAAPVSYEEWLRALGMLDKRAALGELLEEGAELRELAQMDADDFRDDVLEDPDLALDDEMKAKFQHAVSALALAGSTYTGGSSASAAAEAVASCELFERLVQKVQPELELRAAAPTGAASSPRRRRAPSSASSSSRTPTAARRSA